MELRRGEAPWDRVLPIALLIAAASLLGLLILPYVALPDPGGFVRTGLFVVVTLTAVWVLLQVMGRVFERATYRVWGHARARSIWRVVSYVMWGIIFLALVFGFLGNVASTALGLGLVGAAPGFILQKPLQNLAGWVLITSRQLYRIGDRIALGGVRGYVTDIGLMYTELQEFGEWMHGDTFTGRIVTVPNILVIEGAVHNYTRDFPCVWDEVETLVTYESDIDAAKNHVLSAAMQVVGGIMYENFEKYRDHLTIRDLGTSLPSTPEARMEFADSGVRLYVVYFCPADQRRKIKGQLVEAIWRRFSSDPRVGIAYPHLQIVGEVGEEKSPAARRLTQWLAVPEPPDHH